MKEEFLSQHEAEMDELQVNLNRLQTVTSFLCLIYQIPTW